MPCGLEEVYCPGGLNGWNGCPMPNTCMPATGNCFGNWNIGLFLNSENYLKKPFTIGSIGTDGNACPVVCPSACGTGQMNCYVGMDANGCMMPDTCAPINGNQLKSNIF